MKRAANILALLVYFFCGNASGQFRLIDPSTDLNTAMSEYDNENYGKAFDEFSAMVKKYPNDSHNSIFRFMAAKSAYKNSEYQTADSLCDDFIKTFPRSTYLQEALLFKGHSLFKQGRYADAADSYVWAIEIDYRTSTSGLARSNLMPLVNRGLTNEQLGGLLAKHPPSPATESLEYLMAKRDIDAGNYRKGVAALQDFMNRFPGSHEFKQARILYEESINKAESEISIGLLVPLQGNYEEYGRSMVEGARLALKEHKGGSINIEIDIKDTGGDPSQASDAAKELADDQQLAVIGPLSSESASSAALILNQRKIPMITPTASKPGLAGTGPYIFQISPSAEQIGAALGKFAISNLKMFEFAIIAPDDSDGIAISNSFTEAVYKHGGEVISTTYYPAGATDFKDQIMPLHDILASRVEAMLADGRIDSSEVRDPKTHKVLDKDEWPVNLAGLFLPGYPDELKMLIPQVRYHVIRTRFLGSFGWDSPDLMRDVKQYVANAVYATDFHIDPDDQQWKNFSGVYRAEYGHVPDKVAAATYDAMKLVLAGIDAGNKDPGTLQEYLSQIQNYDGVSSVITFKGTGRANDEVGIYSVNGRKLTESE